MKTLTKKELKKYLLEKYGITYEKYNTACYDEAEKYYEGQYELIEDMFTDLFGYKDFYDRDGMLYAGKKCIGSIKIKE